MKKKLLPPGKWLPSSAAQTDTKDPGFEHSDARKALISRVESLRKSKVLVFIEANQPAPEIRRHLRSAHRQTHHRLDLVLFSRAIDTGANTAQRAAQMIALLREHTREVGVLIPSVAHGLGTCLAIGADQVLLHPLASLGGLSQARALTAPRHFGLWMQAQGIDAPELRQDAWLRFIDEAHPAQLAAAHAVHTRFEASLRHLIAGRVRPQDAQNDALISLLDDPSCPLGHPSDRRRARDLLTLPMEPLEADLEAALWDLFCAYEHPLGLLEGGVLGGDAAPTTVLETEGALHCYTPPRHGKLSGRKGGWTSVFPSELH
jgi:hypothetical protein